ncbi:uncharacterized protein LOC123316562 [Coccinella septempunctata]|uniref:uncharacterized protein LOC123316562 n=1 Tax=Coccinella septempunctata TaxID=41139 RepID=UPI001D0656FB|nr:uncharacterized protein LOC123316562 [Coccinella septempunctata]
MAEPTEMDLLEAVKESLHNDGTLGKFKAELRAAVMSILNKNHVSNEPPKIPEETKLINELMREYMIWNGYLYSEQIFTAECGHSKERLERDVLTTKLGVIDDAKTSKIPLLYYIVSAFQNQQE